MRTYQFIVIGHGLTCLIQFDLGITGIPLDRIFQSEGAQGPSGGRVWHGVFSPPTEGRVLKMCVSKQHFFFSSLKKISNQHGEAIAPLSPPPWLH